MTRIVIATLAFWVGLNAGAAIAAGQIPVPPPLTTIDCDALRKMTPGERISWAVYYSLSTERVEKIEQDCGIERGAGHVR
jgi:hypothetical protein